MNSQRLLPILLVAFIVLAVGGAMGYFLFVEPISEKNTAAAKLAKEAGDLELKLLTQQKGLIRLAEAKKRSLPADEAIANREYQDVLYAILQQAKAPAGATVKPRALDQKTVPTVTAVPKKPAYIRMGYDISLTKADLRSLVGFLEAFYKLNLLHQITSIELRRAEEVTSGGKFTAPDGSDRKDLNITIKTEALILDSAEARRSVVPVPLAFAAVGGNAGYQAVSWTPSMGHRLTPLQSAPVLASQSRDYYAMIAHDPFHGTLPKRPPPPPVSMITEDDLPPSPPKPDISPFIRLVGITLRPEDGTAGIEVKDVMNNTEYEIHFSPTRTQVQKYVGTAGRRQPDPAAKASDAFVISDPESSTSRQFKVVGVDFDVLYLIDLKDAGKPLSGLPALVGGHSVLAPVPAKILRWQLGDSLKKLSLASPEEARRILERRVARR